MSKLNLDEPGFTAPAVSTGPPSSDSSAEPTPDSRSKCLYCPRRMSAKTADRHTVCVVCRGYDCNLETRCEECIEWPDEEVRLYAKMRKSLKSKGSSKHRPKPSASSPPSAASIPPSQPHALVDMQTQDPRVGEVESEVTAKASSLTNRSKPLSSTLTTHYTRHAVADLPYYASSLAVNLSFSQLAGAKAVGSKRWGSVSFAEMEKLERLFQAQLEVTSKSLWLMSGILAMLKRDGFQPADPTLFNAALASASATLSQTARSSAAGSTFVRAKRRDSLLAHIEIPVPKTQRRALTVSPGSEALLFDEEILGVVVSQVQQSSLISSNLAMSRSLARGRGLSTSSPLAAPASAGAFCQGQQHRKRSSSSSRFNSRKRSREG